MSSIATSGSRILPGCPEKPRDGPQTTSLQAMGSRFKSKNPEANTLRHFAFTLPISNVKGQLLGISCELSEPSLPLPFLVVLIKVGYMENRPKPIGMLGLEGELAWMTG